MRIPAICLWQPYADLVVHGFKKYETRHWANGGPHGVTAIHATKRWTNEQKRMVISPNFIEPCSSMWGFNWNLEPSTPPLQCIVGLVVWGDAIPSEVIRPKLIAAGDHAELAFGNYAKGRFAHVLNGYFPFADPIPMPGKQSKKWYWDIPEHLIKTVRDFQDKHQTHAK